MFVCWLWQKIMSCYVMLCYVTSVSISQFTFHFFQLKLITLHYTIAILDNIRRQEASVLELWTAKQKRQNDCLQYVTFEQNAKQVRSISNISYKSHILL